MEGRRRVAVCSLFQRADMKPTIPEIAPLVQQLYATPGAGAGCCLHIVLDDQNVDNHFVQSCLENAINRKHVLCERIAGKMLLMSRTQRLKLSKVR